jgi:phosphohistidine swiveling domain-containing protein
MSKHGAGTVLVEAVDESKRSITAIVPAPVLITGQAASRGRAVGTARVLVDPSTIGLLRAGEILVVPTASTEWIIGAQHAAAVVVESGGPLSSLATVCREMRIPVVVAAAGATWLIPTGACVDVDGAAGQVRLLS